MLVETLDNRIIMQAISLFSYIINLITIAFLIHTLVKIFSQTCMSRNLKD